MEKTIIYPRRSCNMEGKSIKMTSSGTAGTGMRCIHLPARKSTGRFIRIRKPWRARWRRDLWLLERDRLSRWPISHLAQNFRGSSRSRCIHPPARDRWCPARPPPLRHCEALCRLLFASRLRTPRLAMSWAVEASAAFQSNAAFPVARELQSAILHGSITERAEDSASDREQRNVKQTGDRSVP